MIRRLAPRVAALAVRDAAEAAPLLATELHDVERVIVLRSASGELPLRDLGRGEIAVAGAWDGAADVLARSEPGSALEPTALLGVSAHDALWESGFGVRAVPSLDAPDEELWRPAQSSQRVFAMRPLGFAYNADAAADNSFMGRSRLSADALRRTVVMEHDGLVDALQQAGVSVLLGEYRLEHGTPDAIFPNNWFSTHSATPDEPARLALYPMAVPNRRLERRPDLLALLRQREREEVDLRGLEDGEGQECLEGTGSLVLDRVRRRAFVNLSQRSTQAAAEQWCEAMGYELVAFRAVDEAGADIYHTNVLMAVGSSAAVVCLEAIPDARDRERVLAALAPLAVVEISRWQMNRFCGNVLEVRDGMGRPKWAMSTGAHDAFTEAQREVLGEIVHAPMPTVEKVGGGGVRCCLGEVF